MTYFRCTVGDITGEGHGTSKKAGKHQAAENVLSQLKAGIVPGEEKPESKQEIPENVSLSYGGEINPVGTLQVSNTCSKMSLVFSSLEKYRLLIKCYLDFTSKLTNYYL